MNNIFHTLAAVISADQAGVPKLDANNVVTGVLNTVYFAAGVAAIIVIVVAGIFYATSGGDAGRTKQAREAIIYAVVGLIVVMMAFVITSFIAGRF